MQGKTKWKSEKTNLAIGEIVIIQDKNLPLLKWKLGKVIEVYTGTDSRVRIVTLKTMSGICKRAINQLCKLPMTDSLTVCDIM